MAKICIEAENCFENEIRFWNTMKKVDIFYLLI